MKTLIVYGTKHGCAEQCSKLLASKLSGECTVVNIADGAPDLSEFDTVIVGGSVYVGKIQQPLRDFCDNNLPILQTKKLGLFICAANVEQATEQLKANFSVTLLEVATATGHFGYAIKMDRMNFLERTAIKMIMKTKESKEVILEQNISKFAEQLA